MARGTPRGLLALALMVASALAVACSEPKPAITGRLRAPVDIVVVRGCPQDEPACEKVEQGHHLLLIANGFSDDLRVFDAEARRFFEAGNALFPLSIPVGEFPRAVAVDPLGEFAFVLNGLSEDLSVVDLAPNRLVEVDTDWDSSTCAASLSPESDRCRAGVSRASLGPDGPLAPEDLAVPAGVPDEVGTPWDRLQPLPLYASLPGSGQLAVLNFTYPGSQPGYAQRLDLMDVIDLGGLPSGLAVRRDGTQVFVADEDSDSIAVLDTDTREILRVPVGGPSRRVYLTPDESVLYVVRLDDGRLALVDTASLTRRAPGEAPEFARNPRDDGQDLFLLSVGRGVAFAQGKSIYIQDDSGESREYTTELLTTAEIEAGGEQHVVTTFAYVSDLNGNIYLFDAENHREVDVQPFNGPSLGQPGYVEHGSTLATEDLEACIGDPACPYPMIAEFGRTYDGVSELDPIYHGIRVTPGKTRSESWVLTYEGILPATDNSTSGRLSNWRLEDDRPGLDFTAAGVQVGDDLQLLSPPLLGTDGLALPECRPGEGADKREAALSGIQVTAVEPNALELRAVTGVDLAVCWPEAIRYRVRAVGAWTVLGTLSGLQPRLTAVPYQDPPPATPAYSNGYFSLTLFEPGPDEQGQPRAQVRDSAWGFNADDGFYAGQFAPSISAGMAGELLTVDLEDESPPVDDRIFLLFEASNALMEFFPSELEASNYILYQ